MNQLTTDVISHYVITIQGNHYPITAAKERALRNASNQDVFQTQTGAQIKVSTIAEIIPALEYLEHYPQKQTVNYNEPRKAVVSLEELASKYAWTGYPKMLELTVKTHKALTEWLGDFRDFCIRHKAILPDGSVVTMKAKDKNGKDIYRVFAYSFFQEIKKLIDDRKRSQDYAQEKSWEEIAGAEPITLTQRMEQYYKQHPEKKSTPGYKFYLAHMSNPSKAQNYIKNRKDFDPSKESWDQFKERVWQ